MPDFSKRTLIWGGGHGLSRAFERHKPPALVEQVVRTSTEQDQGKKRGRWIIWGCVGNERTKVIVQEINSQDVIIVSVMGVRRLCN